MTGGRALPGRENQRMSNVNFRQKSCLLERWGGGCSLVLRTQEDSCEMVTTGLAPAGGGGLLSTGWEGRNQISGGKSALLKTPMVRLATFCWCVMVITPLQVAGAEQTSMAVCDSKHEHAVPLCRKRQTPGRGKWP